MDQVQKLQFQRDVETYLEENKVYDIFEDLMKALVIEKPDSPLDFLINKLSQPEQKRMFIVGPPQSQVRELSLGLSNHLKYTCVSVGDLLKKEISKKSDLGWKIQKSVEQFSYVTDDIVIDIAKKQIEELEKEQKNYILEGFPKTRVQGLALQKMGIIPDTFMIYNIVDQEIVNNCLKKLNENSEGYYNNIKQLEYSLYAQNHALEYNLNINQVKEIYQRHYFQVDGDNNREPLEDMARLVKFKLENNAPKRSQKIIITGPPGSGRTTLAKHLAKKYGFVYVSTRELIADQISKNTEVGKKCLIKLKEGDLVPDEIVNGLINARIQQVDCHIQGFVLDGFPKSVIQLVTLDQLKINPTMIVVLECSDRICFERLSSQQIDPITGIIYDRSNLPTDTLIKKRLTKPPNQNVQQLHQRNKAWKELLKSLETNQTFAHLIFKTNSSDSTTPQNILESVSIHLEKNVQ